MASLVKRIKINGLRAGICDGTPSSRSIPEGNVRVFGVWIKDESGKYFGVGSDISFSRFPREDDIDKLAQAANKIELLVKEGFLNSPQVADSDPTEYWTLYWPAKIADSPEAVINALKKLGLKVEEL